MGTSAEELSAEGLTTRQVYGDYGDYGDYDYGDYYGEYEHGDYNYGEIWLSISQISGYEQSVVDSTIV
jgi:hypothetical protein